MFIVLICLFSRKEVLSVSYIDTEPFESSFKTFQGWPPGRPMTGCVAIDGRIGQAGAFLSESAPFIICQGLPDLSKTSRVYCHNSMFFGYISIKHICNALHFPLYCFANVRQKQTNAKENANKC